MKRFILALALVIISGCVSQGLNCKEPFVKIGDTCCLDRNTNGICDFYEKTTTTQTPTTTVVTTTTSTTVIEGLQVSDFKDTCKDNGNTWCESDGVNAFTIDIGKANSLNEDALFYLTVTTDRDITNLEVDHICEETSPTSTINIYHQDGESWRGVEMQSWFYCYKCQTGPCKCDAYPKGDKVALLPAGENLKYYLEFDPYNAAAGAEFDVSCIFTFMSDQQTIEKNLVFKFA